ncbi:MAG: A/G-specific adenine glycosylase [Ruminococcaceae bacterium]|nr:A/G-specific adenine glycosylase [Oscillospiraceae bacterium]
MKDIVPLILDWYEKNKKSLPWRHDPTPYEVWVSEIMLQQTRIEAVIPYYRRFLCEYPTVEALAAADDDRLMKLWEGLGYYSRARNLKKAAEIIVKEYGGRLPRRAAELRGLPGIGEYTAGAVASIAFGEPEPAVDGNVLRVLSRVEASAADIALAVTKRAAAEKLRALYPTGRDAARLTEGLMELGESVCIPNGEPRCGECPLRTCCRAYLTDTVSLYPVKSAKKPRRAEERTVLLLCDGGRYGIRKREEGGLLGGLWEFPNLPGHLTEREAASAASELGFCCESIRPLGEAKHIFTHVEWRMIGYELTGCGKGCPMTFADGHSVRRDYALPAAFRFYAELMGE